MQSPLSVTDLLADPEGAMRRMIAARPVALLDIGPAIVGHEALREALLDTRLRPSFSDFLRMLGITSGPFYEWMSLSPLDMDGDEHKRWRALMSKTFTPRSVERLRPFLRSESERLVAEFADAGNADFVESFAKKLPSLGLCELIGVPAADRGDFGAWADTIGLGFNFALVGARISEIDDALVALLDYAGRLVKLRREHPEDDLVTRIAQAALEDGFPEERIRGSVAGLVFAGHETTKNQLGWAIVVLSQLPAEWDRLAREPERVRDVVEELLRFKSAVTSIGRTATEDLAVNGVAVAKGNRVIGHLWSANRDPGAFPAPEAFDVEANRASAQIAFGHGAHHCLGAALARAELQEALVVLAKNITCPRIEPGAAYLPPVGITGPLSLPISFSRR
jgi:cytochrome P450